MKVVLKILKWLLIIIIALVAIFFIYNATQPSQITLEESIEIEAPASSIYAEIIDFKGWNEWSAWHKMDPEMKQEYSDNFGEVGSFSAWESQNPMVGIGRQDVIEIEENKRMKVEMSFDGWEGKSYASFHLNEVDGKTEVKWDFEGAETPIFMNWMNTMMGKMVRDNYKKGLKDLKEVVESKPTEIPNPMNIEELEVEARDIISIKDSCGADEIGTKLGELYAELSIYLSSVEGAESSGMPLALYHYYSAEKVVLEAALPYSGEIEASGRITVGQTPSGSVLKGIHKGDYNASGAMHEALEAYMKAKGLEFGKACWEEYVNDPTEVDSADVEIHIYYPYL